MMASNSGTVVLSYLKISHVYSLLAISNLEISPSMFPFRDLDFNLGLRFGHTMFRVHVIVVISNMYCISSLGDMIKSLEICVFPSHFLQIVL